MGGDVAAPVFREIADKLYATRMEHNSPIVSTNLKKDSTQFYYAGATRDIKMVMQTFDMNYNDSSANNNWARLYADNHQTVLNKEIISKQQMPDVKGMGLKDALYLLESMNMKVMAKGKGRVKIQSVQPGTVLNKNQNITLELN